MRQGSGVDNHAVDLIEFFVNDIDDPTFMIGLKKKTADSSHSGVGLNLPVQLIQGHLSVNIRLPNTQQIQIGAVHNENPFVIT